MNQPLTENYRGTDEDVLRMHEKCETHVGSSFRLMRILAPYSMKIQEGRRL